MRNVSFAIGPSCFTVCRGCHNNFAKTDFLSSPKELKNFGRYLVENGVTSVTLSGGDPLSRPDILKILAIFKQLGMTIKLDTVGTPLLGKAQTIFRGQHKVKPVTIKAIDPTQLKPFVDLLGLPLDGATEAIAQLFRHGRDNLVAETLELLQQTEKATIPVAINTVVHQGNYQQLTAIGKCLTGFAHIKQWQLFQFAAIGGLGFLNRKAFEISDETFEAATAGLHGYPFAVIPKSCRARYQHGPLINSAGTAWRPAYDEHGQPTGKALIIGNLAQEELWPDILAAIPDR